MELREVPYGGRRGDLIVTVVHFDHGRVEEPTRHAKVSQRVEVDGMGFSLNRAVYYHFVGDPTETYEWNLIGGTYFKVSLHHF